MKNIFIILLIYSTMYANSFLLQQAIKSALATHPNIKIALYKSMVAKKDITLQKSVLMPQITLRTNYNTEQTFVMPRNQTFHTIDSDGWSIGMDLKQRIFDFGETKNRILATKIKKEIAQLSLQKAKALLISKVKIAYGALIVQKKAIAIYKSDFLAKEAFLQEAIALWKQGLKTKADLYSFKASALKTKEQLAKAKARWQKAVLDFKELTGVNVDKKTALEKDILFYKESFPQNITKNFDLQMMQKEVIAAKYEEKSAKKAKFGQIEAIASWTHTDALAHYNDKKFGFTYSVSLYNGKHLRSIEQKKHIQTLIVKEQQKNLEHTITKTIGKLKSTLFYLKASIEANQESIHALKETKKIVHARYKKGLATYVELLDAQSRLSLAKLSLLMAYYNYYVTQIQLEYFYGK